MWKKITSTFVFLAFGQVVDSYGGYRMSTEVSINWQDNLGGLEGGLPD